MSFEPKDGSSYDADRDLEIYRPRVEPAPQQNGADFEFAIRFGQKTTGVGTGCSIRTDDEGVVHWQFQIETAQELEHHEEQRNRLAPDMALFDFLSFLASGMTQAFATGSGLFGDCDFRATVPIALLTDRGLDSVSITNVSADNDLVLSYLFVPTIVDANSKDRPLESCVIQTTITSESIP